MCSTPKCSKPAEVGDYCIDCYNKNYDKNHRPASTKKCSTCKKEKLLAEFWKRNNTEGGYKSQCTICCTKVKIERLKRLGKWKYKRFSHKKGNSIYCVMCEKYRQPINFGKDKHSTTGKRSHCKECDKVFWIRKKARLQEAV